MQPKAVIKTVYGQEVTAIKLAVFTTTDQYGSPLYIVEAQGTGSSKTAISFHSTIESAVVGFQFVAKSVLKQQTRQLEG